MRAIEKLLAAADISLTNSPIVNNNRVTDSVYDGYLAAFGPAVITSGLLQTLSVYEADEKRKVVLNVIAKVACIQNTTTGNSLYRTCLQEYMNKDLLNTWREKIINASVALKLVIRTFDLQS